MAEESQVLAPDDPELAALSEEIYKLICPHSLEVMTDPRTLPCGHTLDHGSILRLSEEGNGTITCPVCRAAFDADNVQLEVNTITKRIIEGIKGLNAKRIIVCDRCNKRVAKLACQDCGMLFCQTCFDLVHQGRLKEHRWNYLDVAVQKELPYCSVPGHEEYRLDLYSPSTNEFICLMCQATSHRDLEVYPVIKAAHFAKDDLQEWIADTSKRRRKLKSVVQAIDKVIESLELRAEDELRTLDELLNALIDKLESQAKVISDKIVERKIAEVDKLCAVRKEIIATVGNMTDDVARAERAINLSDAVELILMDREIVKQPPPLTIHLPQYTVPWVGPEQDLGQMFSVDFLPAQDPVWLDPVFQDIVVQPSALEYGGEMEGEVGDGKTRLGTLVPSDFVWALDTAEKGQCVTLSTNNMVATTNCNDTYTQSGVLGNVAMDYGVWFWKVKLINLVGSKQVCYGVTRKPFDHNNPKPYKMMWGWSSNGCALPSYETRNAEAKVHSGEEVWIKFNADIGRVEAYWPATGMSGNIDIGTNAQGKTVYPVFVMGRRGNTLEVEPVQHWAIDE
eukprot:NODE_243_length_1934_cov_96.175597_g193_i0.p1 GENE.NODE_243_length_1934_cov_96.175597_g193_i0~~NODE_243_length_1934_cov_96.175597_g193_i0.p1  ORF type:complete len:565 (+),score=136.22 NODE_243_length_1934_cov_96.175597_g193_i0:67-1761(+)